jgi:hypothetical protein
MFNALKPVALATALSLTGCSFLLVRGPGDVGNPPTVYADCTTSLTWPAVDAGLGLLWGLGVATTATRDLEPNETEDSRQEAIIGASILGAVAIASAVVGYRRTQRCEESHAAYTAAYPQGRQQPYYPGYPQQGYPQPYPPQPYPPQPGYPQPYPPQPAPAPATPAPPPSTTPAPAP